MASKRVTNNSTVTTLEDQTRIISVMSEKGGGQRPEKASNSTSTIEKTKAKKKIRVGKGSQDKTPLRPLDPQGTSSDVTAAQTRGAGTSSASRSRPPDEPAAAANVGGGGDGDQGDAPSNPGDVSNQAEADDLDELEQGIPEGDDGNQFVDPDYRQWLWQQQMQQMNVPQFGNFMPNFPFGNVQQMSNWGYQMGIPHQPVGINPGRSTARQPDHEISDDEDDVPIPANPALIPASTGQNKGEEGASAELLKEQLGQVSEADRVSPPVGTKVAQLLDRYLKDAMLVSEMEKAVKKYPRVENCERMKVQRLDVEVFQGLEQNLKTCDQNFQGIQRGIMAAMAAIAPVLDLVFQRKLDDPELDALGTNVMNGLQLMAFASNSIAGKRRDLLKPHLAPIYAKVMTKAQEESVDWLYGGDLTETTKQCETAKKIGEKVIKRKQPFQGRGRGRRFKPLYNTPTTYPMMRAFNPVQVRFPAPQQFVQQQFPNPQMFQPTYGGFAGGFAGYPKRFRGQRPRHQNFAKRGAYQK